MRISLIAAMGRNHVIGNAHGLPWHLPSDLKRFRERTIGKPVIMGRKTWESIGGIPLHNRINIVLSRSQPEVGPANSNVRFLPDVESALKFVSHYRWPESMVIGGGEVYRQFLPLADRMYLTMVDAEPEGTATFPQWDETEWDWVYTESVPADARNSLTSRFTIYNRVAHA